MRAQRRPGSWPGRSCASASRCLSCRARLREEEKARKTAQQLRHEEMKVRRPDVRTGRRLSGSTDAPAIATAPCAAGKAQSKRDGGQHRDGYQGHAGHLLPRFGCWVIREICKGKGSPLPAPWTRTVPHCTPLTSRPVSPRPCRARPPPATFPGSGMGDSRRRRGREGQVCREWARGLPSKSMRAIHWGRRTAPAHEASTASELSLSAVANSRLCRSCAYRGRS